MILSGCEQVAVGFGGLARGLETLFLMVGALFLSCELAALYRVWRRWGRGSSGMLGPLSLAFVLLCVHGLLAFEGFTGMQDGRGYATAEAVAFCMTVLLPAFTVLLGLSGLRERPAPPDSLASRAPMGAAASLALLGSALLGAGIYAVHVPWFPTPVPAPGVPQLYAAGRAHACVLTSAGAALCWGSNRQGQLGTGPSPRFRPRASAVEGLVGATALISGAQHTCALRGGQVLCWGENTEGMFGSGFPRSVSVPTPILGITDAVELKALDEALWIRRQSGAIRGLGFLPESGLVIQSDTAPGDTVELAGGSGFLCFRREGGSVLCHLQAHGESQPREITLAGGPFTALAATESEICAIHQDGHVGCWEPAATAAAARSAQIDALRDCAIKRELAVALAAARRSAGRRPTPPEPVVCDAADKPDPPLPESAVPDLADARSLAASPDHLCVVSRDGTVRCWGRGRSGQLGDGRVRDSQAAVAVSLPGPAARVFVAKELSCAGLRDSRFFCWGASPLGIESKAFVVCNDTWLARVWCAATPGAVTVLPTSR